MHSPQEVLRSYFSDIDAARTRMREDPVLGDPVLVRVRGRHTWRHRLAVPRNGTAGPKPDESLLEELARLFVPPMPDREAIIDALLAEIFADSPPTLGVPAPPPPRGWEGAFPLPDPLLTFGPSGDEFVGGPPPIATLQAAAREVRRLVPEDRERLECLKDLRGVFRRCIEAALPAGAGPGRGDRGDVTIAVLGLLAKTKLPQRPRYATAMRVGELFDIEAPPAAGDPVDADDCRWETLRKRLARRRQPRSPTAPVPPSDAAGHEEGVTRRSARPPATAGWRQS